jgi:hypothetical protein
MMRWKILCLWMGAALGTLGLSRLEAAVPNQPTFRPETVHPEEAYVNTRWIAALRKPESPCPAIEGWNGRRLIDEALVDVPPRERVILQKFGLDRFCVYTTDDPRSRPFPKRTEFLSQERDRMALSGSATELDKRVWDTLAGAFASQTGAGIGTSLGASSEANVRLTFIDSQPTGSGLPAQPPPGSLHGYTLLHLAAGLACPSGRCVASRRALEQTEFDPNLPVRVRPAAEAGSIGTVTQLGNAITAEVLRWQPTESSRHLILNLSLGWDGELFGDLKGRSASDLEPSVQYVYNALRFAAEKKALVIAAAGNRRGGVNDSQWPLLPAAWELSTAAPKAAASPPLVYAVGGIDWQGLSLPNARTGGRPQRSAYGDHAVTKASNGEATAILTGSSVATAVVSSVAAVVWSLRPELQPAEVMRLIDGSAEPLPNAKADFYLLKGSQPAPPLLRVDLCRAIQAASPKAAVRCRKWEPHPPGLGAKFADVNLPATPAPKQGNPSAGCPAGSQAWLNASSSVSLVTTCPANQFPSVDAQRWVLPQPEDAPCPGCSLIPPRGAATTYTMMWQPSPGWQASVSSGAVTFVDGSAFLEIDCPNAPSLQNVQVPVLPGSSALQPVPGLADGQSLQGCRAQLNLLIQKGAKTMSVQNPVVIEP